MHLVTGSNRLQGNISVSGAKNSLLPLICASLLTTETTLTNAPSLRDSNILLNILKRQGVDFQHDEDVLNISTQELNKNDSIDILGDDVSLIRYSTILMGALIGRGYKKIKISYPGGCSSFGTRPIDIHLVGFEAFGVKLEIHDSFIVLDCSELVDQVEHKLRFPSVGATLNLILASFAISGKTVVDNIAIEPEVLDLLDFLSQCGLSYKFLSERKIELESTTTYKSVKHSVIPDRIETVTFLVLGAVCSEEKLTILNANKAHTTLPIDKLRQMGLRIDDTSDGFVVYRCANVIPTTLNVGVYPEIGTDYQPLFACLMAFAQGTSEIVDPIYPKRFAYLKELRKLGIESTYFDGFAKISGNPTYNSTGEYELMCHDLRAGFAALLFAILNEGKTLLKNSHQISRGYYDFERKLKKIGADIEKVDNE
ncbi:UDP-N-acetylglucosamine 1-carboxyvinyltransferase [Vibrio cholerae]